MAGNNGPGDGGERAFTPIYAPQRLGGDGGPQVELPTGNNSGELIRQLPADPEIGTSTVPYQQVYADYREAANRAMEQQHIPLGLRSYVRDYFSLLDPNE